MKTFQTSKTTKKGKRPQKPVTTFGDRCRVAYTDTYNANYEYAHLLKD